MPVSPAEILALRPTLTDNMQLQQAFAAKQAADQQALQTGAIDQQTKANALKTQLLYAAAQTGDQGIYDNTKAKLGQFGIDTSDFAPDVATGAKQADAARLAASPLGSLLNTATKFDANNIAAATAAGQVPQNPNGVAQALLGGNMGPLTGQAAPTTPNAPVKATAQPMAIGNTQASANIAAAPDANTIAAQLAATGGGPGMKLDAPNLPNRADPKYNDPTRTQAANQANFAADLDTAKASPAYIAAAANAGVQGKDAGEKPAQAANSQEITDRLTQNVKKLLSLNDKVPDSTGVNPDVKAFFSKRFGSGSEAGALAQWNQVDQQQILSDYGQLVSSGAIKGSRQIFQALQTGSGVPVDEPASARADLLNNLLSEIQNKNVTAQNVNSRLNGGALQPYVPIGAQDPNATAPVSVSSEADILKLAPGTRFSLNGRTGTRH